MRTPELKAPPPPGDLDLAGGGRFRSGRRTGGGLRSPEGREEEEDPTPPEGGCLAGGINARRRPRERHFIICLYGAIVLGLILAGELKERRIIYILTVHYGLPNSVSGLYPHVVQWLLVSHNTQLLLIVFLLVISLLLAGFFGYHAHLCLTNTTTNETFKWQDYLSLKKKLNEVKASSAALKASMEAMNGGGKAVESKWKAFFRKSPLQKQEAVVKNNMYDKGMISNVCEILFPLSERRSFICKKSA